MAGTVDSPVGDEVGPIMDDLVQIIQVAFSTRQELVVLAGKDTTTMSPEDLHERLLTSRKVVDVLEFQLVKALLAKSRADRLKAQRLADVEDAEIALAEPATDSYLSARERGIAINSNTIASRRNLRRANNAAAEAFSVVESVKAMHRGADSYRRELDTRLRSITLITSMER